MKNLFLLLFIVSFSFGFSQSVDIYKKAAEETCNCLDGKNLNAENLEM